MRKIHFAIGASLAWVVNLKNLQLLHTTSRIPQTDLHCTHMSPSVPSPVGCRGSFLTRNFASFLTRGLGPEPWLVLGGWLLPWTCTHVRCYATDGVGLVADDVPWAWNPIKAVPKKVPVSLSQPPKTKRVFLQPHQGCPQPWILTVEVLPLNKHKIS